ncbi:undecaprenyl-diphosphate phosphatase [Aquirufa nivalisilvae]|jgi:undecaprenyl-diphosphatase|uniref:Undecaprenyl-diphosphatase n=1 Tax=Aquirufa nivalisilvae TaxID=2516557 RepID=A0A2S2DV81_9BACT|nr:undecaprenyl-diphosphate phosphatase [Aquirufa nivalisilvae]AWL09273.1 Undecaprenyl-diphosphate phosphatase [Aquirufa nivalisilvae]MCZ2480230.1 undecaprenyl-diphosphate phosphatase [Aquirufa nivalisilvae]MCZ2482375.1 undecaprenyl-diphosphate phosphatase [Aquirufa nivalisilvae]
MNQFLEAIVLGIVEGLSEFLPISSTAHIIVAEKLLGIESSKYLNFFTVFIQLGAIAAVPFLYFKRLFQSISVYKYIIASFIPAAIFGVLLDDLLESLFQGYWFIAGSWFIGGLLLIKIDDWVKDKDHQHDNIDKMSISQSIKIGLYQCLAMIPGVSRSGASIIGGRLVGLNHRAAVEFSFLLGIPTILGACAKKLVDYRHDLDIILNPTNSISLLVGAVISFVIALLTIRWMVDLVNKFGFKFFGYYRVLAGIFLAIYLWMN